MSHSLVFIEKLALTTKVGCSNEERAFPQKVFVSIKIELVPLPSDQEFTLDNSVCYDTLRKLTLALADSREWTLVEHLAEHILSMIFSEFSPPQTAWVKIEKPIYPDCKTAGVEISRSRES